MKNKIINIITNKNILWNIIGITANSIYSMFLTVYITRVNGIEASGNFHLRFILYQFFKQLVIMEGEFFKFQIPLKSMRKVIMYFKTFYGINYGYYINTILFDK